MTFRAAQDREEEQQTGESPSVLRNRLQALFSQALERAREQVGSNADQYKAAFQEAISKATYDELTAFTGFRPATKADLDNIDPEKINQAITLCHGINKNLPSNQEAEISLDDILAIRAESIPSGQDGQQSAPSESERSPEELIILSDKGLKATEMILAVIGNKLKDKRVARVPGPIFRA